MKSIFIWLTLICWIALSTGYTQKLPTDSLYCLSLANARLLVADALRLRVSDSINNVLAERVQLLESKQMAQYESFTNLLKSSEQKFERQKEITSDMERLANSWRDEADYYRKRYRKQRNQKGLLTAATVGLIILIVVK